MLNDKQIRAAEPKAKGYKLYDARGLFLLITPAGGKGWRFRYRFDGREKLLSLGTYPDTSLKKARAKLDEVRSQLADGFDPSAVRKHRRVAQASSFAAVATEWLGRQKKLKPITVRQLRERLDNHVIPYIGRDPIASLTAPKLLDVLRRIEGQGSHETAHRVRSLMSRIFRFAVAEGSAERDPAADLKGALATYRNRHYAAITESRGIAELLRALDGYQGQPAVMYALRLAPLVFVRPGELRGAEWREFDLEAAEWAIPAERMKMNEAHVVPLATQSVELLEELRPLTGGGRLVFPSIRSPDRPISDNTLNAALRRLDFSKDEMTAHGFRAMASSQLHELGFDSLLIELQLAHGDKNQVRAAYNRAARLPERRKMMQAWADYLDGLRSGAKVIPMRSR